MEKITFRCETITPMFLAGADGITPELRAPSIKGALRFWWRAMNGHLSLKELKEREAEIFGGTGNRSKVVISVNPTTIPNDFQISGDKLKSNYPDYFFFTISIQKQKTEEGDFFRKGINTGFVFDIKIQSRKVADLKEVIKAFYLLVYLGGLGTRTRRGAGTFRVIKINDSKQFLKLWNISFNGSFRKDVVNIQKVNTVSNGNSFSSLIFSEIYQSNRCFPTGQEAIYSIANKMKRLRENNKETGAPFKQKDLNKKAAFGLPISVRNEKETVNFLDIEKNNRRASQFFISVYAADKNKISWIVTKFKDTFMPPNQKIKFKAFEWDEPDYSLSKEFVKELQENKLK